MEQAYETGAPATGGLVWRAYLCGEFYVVIEQLSGLNIGFWTQYLQAMQAYVSKLGTRLGSRRADYGQAFLGFANALEFFGQGHTMCIAYVCSTPHLVGASSAGDMAKKAYEIEMCMTVSTTVDLAFTTHMGIFRSPLSSFFDAGIAGSIGFLGGVAPKQVENHSGVSSWLHAKAALTFCSPQYAASFGVKPKQFMVTCPLRTMADILRSKGAREVGSSSSGEEVRVMERGGSKLFPTIKLMVGGRSLPFGPQNQPWVPRLVFADTHNPAMFISLATLADSHLEATEQSRSPSVGSASQLMRAAVHARKLDAEEDDADEQSGSDDF